MALIQGSIDIEMKHDPTQGERIFDEYFGLSKQAVKERRDLDLIVWPETMFRYPWFTFDERFRAAGRRRVDTAEDDGEQPPSRAATPWRRLASAAAAGHRYGPLHA